MSLANLGPQRPPPLRPPRCGGTRRSALRGGPAATLSTSESSQARAAPCAGGAAGPAATAAPGPLSLPPSPEREPAARVFDGPCPGCDSELRRFRPSFGRPVDRHSRGGSGPPVAFVFHCAMSDRRGPAGLDCGQIHTNSPGPNFAYRRNINLYRVLGEPDGIKNSRAKTLSRTRKQRNQ